MDSPCSKRLMHWSAAAFGSCEQNISSLARSSLMHANSAFGGGEELVPWTRTHAIHRIGFQFSTERASSQPGTASSHFHLDICSSLCEWVRSRRLVFPYERQMPLKFRGQIQRTANGVRLPQIPWKPLKAVVKIWPTQGPGSCSGEAPEGSKALAPARALKSERHLQGSVIYTDLYKIEGTLWNLLLQLHFLRLTRD